MDSFFGIGAPELIFILILAGLLLGPQRIRDVARWLGKTTAQLQAISRTFTARLNNELDSLDEGGDIKGALEEVQDLRRQVAELRQEIGRTLTEPIRETQQALQDGRYPHTQTIMPPAIEAKQNQATNGTAPPPPLKLPTPVTIADDPE